MANDLYVMVNGLPGNMATKVAERVQKTGGLKLAPDALTGPEIEDTACVVGSDRVTLFKPYVRWVVPHRAYDNTGAERPVIAVDFTHPSAVKDNIDFYCKRGFDFVMGTTGGDLSGLEQKVKDAQVLAVVAPNMAPQIVAFQAMMKYMAESFPNAFKGYSLKVVESHQRGKADTSGTAKAMIDYFNALGIPFTVGQIVKVRDPEKQREMGIPENALAGHGWHTYTLRSGDGTVLFSFAHNVNGRDIYADGVIKAIDFLRARSSAGEHGKVYSMIDVLKGA